MPRDGVPPGMSSGPGGMMPNPTSIPGAKMAGGLFGSLKRVFAPDDAQAATAGAPDAGVFAGGSPAQALWSEPFADSLAKQVAANESARPQLLGLLASLPAKAAREKLHAFLEKNWMEGPTALAGAGEKAAGFDIPDPASSAPRTRRKGKKDKDDDQEANPLLKEEPAPAGAVPNQIESFGENWFDPGALVVLKSFTYLERPRDSLKSAPSNDFTQPFLGGGASRRGGAPEPKKSAAQIKREEEKEARLKAAEAKFDWRDAIERFVHVLNARFETVATAPDQNGQGIEPTAAVADAKVIRKIAKADAKSTSKTGIGASGGKVTVDGLPFPLHDGAEITKQFRGEWPSPSGPGAAITDPLGVHYIRIEGEAAYPKAISHYKAAVKGKKPSTLREIENGKWIDGTIDGSTPDRVRSVDVMVTHTPVAPGEKAPKTEPIVVEILVVEIPQVGDAKPAAKSASATK